MTEPNDNLGFRKSYVPRPGRLGGLTPPGGMEPAVIKIVQAWNRLIPKNRVRILTTSRYMLVRSAVSNIGIDGVLAAIEHYSRQTWQRRKGAWKTLDTFFYAAPPRDPPVIEWWEKAVEAAEQQVRRLPVKDRRVAKLQKQIFDRQADMDRWDALRKTFASLPADRQKGLFKKAADELRRLCGPRTDIGPERLRHHALVILARKSET